MIAEEIKKLKVAKVKMQKSLLFFTRYFFKHRFNRKFVVGEHHKQIASALDRVLRGECKRLIINIAPRYGKTELAVKGFIAGALSLNPAAKFIHLSYSDDLARDNSEEIKDIIQTEEYQKAFPSVRIKQGTNSKKKWYTTKGGGVYAVSSAGQVTGFGAGKVDEEKEAVEEEKEEIDEFLQELELIEGFGGAIVIDDPIKPEDAESAIVRAKVNNRFDSTIKNRVNSRNTPIIIIMQRLHPDDLCGHIDKNDPDEWEVLKLPCIKEDGTALWPFKHTLEELMSIRGKTPFAVATFDRQYMQNPKPLAGLLYTKFMVYKDIDFKIGKVESYTDVADTGKDYLFTVVYTEHNNLLYILDIQYTQEAQEETEYETAEMLIKNKVNEATIESNNGGRGFSRNVKRILAENNHRRTTIRTIHQTKNKDSKIKSNSSTVQNTFVYPDNWMHRWPAFYDSMTEYMAKGKNLNDDAQDGLSEVIEQRESTTQYTPMRKRN